MVTGDSRAHESVPQGEAHVGAQSTDTPCRHARAVWSSRTVRIREAHAFH